MGQRWAGAAGASARLAPLQFSLLSARGEQPGWDVRISRRARRLSMRVFPGGRVEVVVPPGVGIPAIERFVAHHRDGAGPPSREFALAAPGAAELQPRQVALAASGQSWLVEYEQGRGQSVSEPEPGVLRACARDPPDPPQSSAALLSWVGDRAGEYLRARINAVSAEIGIDYGEM